MQTAPFTLDAEGASSLQRAGSALPLELHRHVAEANGAGGGVGGVFPCIVADPPWEVERGPEWASNGAARPLTYPTMSVYEIAALPVAKLAAKSAHLYIWTINKYVEDTYWIARAWGFEPSTLLTWIKSPRGIGLGGTYVLTTEHMLFCRRGTLKAKKRVDTSWWGFPRGEHSEKPEDFQTLIESVSPGPYLEMFARRMRPGWSAWGNEVSSGPLGGGGRGESAAFATEPKAQNSVINEQKLRK